MYFHLHAMLFLKAQPENLEPLDLIHFDDELFEKMTTTPLETLEELLQAWKIPRETIASDEVFSQMSESSRCLHVLLAIIEHAKFEGKEVCVYLTGFCIGAEFYDASLVVEDPAFEGFLT